MVVGIQGEAVFRPLLDEILIGKQPSLARAFRPHDVMKSLGEIRALRWSGVPHFKYDMDVHSKVAFLATLPTLVCSHVRVGQQDDVVRGNIQETLQLRSERFIPSGNTSAPVQE